jgi:glycosyltransferase involved in cell wall biosynthesis
MKLVVQIPCHNEAATISQTIREIPRSIPGIDHVAVLVIDDASRDQTAEIAKQAGADKIVSLEKKMGLAAVFRTGLDAALKMGADIIINTDGDNQYPGREIESLVRPVLNREAEMAVGQRKLSELAGYSSVKLFLQRLGSWFTGLLAGQEVRDAASGFRAMSREAALKLNVFGEFSYTLETLIEAGRNRMRLAWVPVAVNPQPGRQSRLYRNVGQYLARSMEAMVRTYSRYEPLRVFAAIGGAVFAGGFGIGIWFLYYFFSAGGKGHVQILILGAVLMIIGFQVFLIGLVADLISGNRKLLEELIYRMRKLDAGDPGQK